MTLLLTYIALSNPTFIGPHETRLMTQSNYKGLEISSDNSPTEIHRSLIPIQSLVHARQDFNETNTDFLAPANSVCPLCPPAPPGHR